MTSPPTSAQQSTGVVRVSISRDPALVRTVRLVGAAVARRRGLPDATVESVRLAVGEACAVMMGTHGRDTGRHADIEIELDDRAADQIVARVSGIVTEDPGEFGGLDLDPWTLLRGACERFDISEDDQVTTVSMVWGA